MAKSVYIYGPAGCGKTRFTEEFKRYFNVGNVVDDYRPAERAKGARAIPDQGYLVFGTFRDDAPEGCRVLHHDSAKAMAGVKE